MTQRDKLVPIHEPFGDAFYYGPERMSPRFEDDKKTRIESGYSDSTYASIFERIAREQEDVIPPLRFCDPAIHPFWLASPCLLC